VPFSSSRNVKDIEQLVYEAHLVLHVRLAREAMASADHPHHFEALDPSGRRLHCLKAAGRFGNWHTIYVRMNRWAKNGVLDRVFEKLQLEQIVRIKIEAFALDSTSVEVHPDGTGALKKTARRRSASRGADGTPRFIWLPRMLERP
jgi:hypothetical protein